MQSQSPHARGTFAIFVAARATVVRILHPRRLKIFFPIRPFFLQWGWAVTDFYPAHGPIDTEPCVLHIAKIFAFCGGALAESLTLNGSKKIAFRTRLNVGSHQVAHGKKTDADLTFS
jgi:hypothetical protein